MYAEQESVLDLFYTALHDPEMALSDFNIAPKVLTALMTTIRMRLKLKPVVIKSTLEITHLGASGVDAIKQSVRETVVALGLWDNLEADTPAKGKPAVKPIGLKIKFTINTPPLYMLTVTCMDKDIAETEAKKLIKAVRESIIASGGVCAIVGTIKISVSGQDSI